MIKLLQDIGGLVGIWSLALLLLSLMAMLWWMYLQWLRGEISVQSLVRDREIGPSTIRYLKAPSVLEPPRLVIEQRVWQKLFCYARLVDTEINGVGHAVFRGGDIVVTDAYTLSQAVSHGDAELDGVAIAKRIDAHVAAGGNATEICVQWHSHAGMPVHWSGKDEATIREYFTLAPYSVSIEVNHRGDVLCRIDLQQPFRLSLEVAPVIVGEVCPEDVREECLADVQRDVRRRESFVLSALSLGMLGAGGPAETVCGVFGDDVAIELLSENGPDGSRLVVVPKGGCVHAND